MKERDLILDYDIIRGLPGDVADTVQRLIAKCTGWQPSGDLKIMKLGDCEVVVQCMVKYES